MLKKSSASTTWCCAFITAELALAVLLQLLQGRASVWCSYGAVVLACLFALLCFEKTPRYALTQAALLATVCADYFLVLRGAEQKFVAMFFFLVAQLCYFARLYQSEPQKPRRIAHAVSRGALCLITLAVTLLVLGQNADGVALISMLYFANLVLNVIFAFALREKPPLFAIGLLLFACCDVFVGLSLIEAYLPLAEGGFIWHLAHPGFNAAWVFYVPSQALIALSLAKRK